jgi:hypothetical protein
VLLLCRADPGITRARLEQRRRDVSDADWSVYLSLAQGWQAVGDSTRPFAHEITSGGGIEETLAQGLEKLRAVGLHVQEQRVEADPNSPLTRAVSPGTTKPAGRQRR